MNGTKFIRYTFNGEEGGARLKPGGALEVITGPEVEHLDQVALLPPVAPTKIVGIGLNYREHAKEMGKKLPEEPMMFLMPATAVIGPGQPIVLPSGYERIDYEGELALIFGERCRNVPAHRAFEVLAGYSCFIDVSVRDLQKRDVQYTRAKGFDTFAPLGPYMVNGVDPRALRITTRLNGDKRQDSSTADMIFSIPRLVEHVTRVMTMLPGDVIATGTPPGVGPLAPGDEVEVEIESLGTLSCPVVAEEPITDTEE